MAFPGWSAISGELFTPEGWSFDAATGTISFVPESGDGLPLLLCGLSLVIFRRRFNGKVCGFIDATSF